MSPIVFFNKLRTYKFKLIAKCNLMHSINNNHEITSQEFSIFTYRSVSSIKLGYNMYVQLFPHDHGQNIKIISDGMR